MLNLPDYTGCNTEYIKSSLAFFTYHANRTMSGKEQTDAIKAINAKANTHKITLEPQAEEETSNG
jgi:hypothetical protein